MRKCDYVSQIPYLKVTILVISHMVNELSWSQHNEDRYTNNGDQCYFWTINNLPKLELHYYFSKCTVKIEVLWKKSKELSGNFFHWYILTWISETLCSFRHCGWNCSFWMFTILFRSKFSPQYLPYIIYMILSFTINLWTWPACLV